MPALKADRSVGAGPEEATPTPMSPQTAPLTRRGRGRTSQPHRRSGRIGASFNPVQPTYKGEHVFCRVTHVQAPEGRVQEGLKLWYENVLPVTMAREGFKGALSLVDADSGKALSITFWEGEDELLSSTEAEYHKRAIERFGEFFTDAHEPENFKLHLFTGDIFNGTFASDEAGEGLTKSK
jgi:hypothetical protein